MKSVEAPPGWLTVRQVCELLGIEKRTVRRWADQGRFKGAIQEQVGSAQGWRWLFPERSVHQVQRERTAAATSRAAALEPGPAGSKARSKRLRPS